MSAKRRFHFSGQMKRDFSRAILTAGVFAAIGVLLVFAALMPHTPAPPAPAPPPLVAKADSCTKSLERWRDLESGLTQVLAMAAELGARCKMLTCPDVDCAGLQELRGTITALSSAMEQVAGAPTLVTDASESEACGAVIAPQAKRLVPGFADARSGLDLCAGQSQCNDLRRARKTAASVIEQMRADVDRAHELAPRLKLAESPPVAISLDLPDYTAGDAMEARIEPGANRCFALGAAIGVYAQGADILSATPLSQAPLEAGRAAKLLLEAPQMAGRYMIAVIGTRRTPQPLGSASFAVDEPKNGCNGFAGRWQTDRGVLTASVRKGILRAAYRRPGAVKPGFLTGTVKGRQFHGAWTSELGSGGAHIVLNSDGSKFLGTAGDRPGQEDGAGLWRGSCLLNRLR